MISKDSLLLTEREIDVINKKIAMAKLTQQDSNYLSRYVRPKLREMCHIDSRLLLKKLEYNQRINWIERKIKDIVLKNVDDVSSISLYGSVIYSSNYNDVDVLVGVEKKFWKSLGSKYRRIAQLKEKAKKAHISLDIKIFLQKEIIESYPTNITLIYELKDSKVIYGNLSLPTTIRISREVLKFHLDYSYSVLLDIKEYELSEISGRELYSAIRNLWIICLITDKIVDNAYLAELLNSELGKNMVDALKNNTASLVQKKMAAVYLEGLYCDAEKIINRIHNDLKWERKTQSEALLIQ